MVLGTQDTFAGEGLNTTKSFKAFEQGETTYIVNGDITDPVVEGTSYFIQNLPGNKECLDLGEDFLGAIVLDNDQLLLFNAPGRIRLATNCTTIELVNAPCFNFSGIIEGRFHYVGTQRVVYWVEEGGKARLLNIDDCLPKVRTSDCQDCDDTFTDEFDCDATLLNPKYTLPDITMTASETGNIPNGVYQLALAFYDENERMTKYHIIPQVLKLFNNQGGNYSIVVNVDPCFTVPFDRVAMVLLTHRVDRGTTAQQIGIFDTSLSNFTITTLDSNNYTPIDIQNIVADRVYYQNADHIAANNESLILAGLHERQKLAGQTVARNITSEWVTMAVSAKDAHLYPSFQRWEVYGFDISFIFCDGQESRRFHIPNDGVDSSRELVTDPENYWEDDSLCDPITLLDWEVNDQSTNPGGYTAPTTLECGPVEVASGKFSYWQSKDYNYPNDDEFGNLKCLPIRYHRFPKTKTHGLATALHTNEPCGDPQIHIMGVRFDNIKRPNYCDGRPGTDIVGYNIYVTDRNGQESILSTGLLYNVRYETLPTGEQSMFQNYPFNDLNSDVFLLEDKKNQGNIFDANDQLNTYHQDKFTYISPDLQYVKGKQANTLEVWNITHGTIRGEYHETKGMPKYQILSPFGRLASLSAGALEAREVLYGAPLTRTTVERITKKKVDRTTNVTGFPVNQVQSYSETWAAPNGAGTVNGTNTNNISNQDYSWTEQGDEDCVTPYTINTVTAVDYDSNGVGTNFDLFPDTCYLEFDTTAPGGTTLSVTLNGTRYSMTIGDDGKATIQLNADCYPVSGGIWTPATVNGQFSPECEATGDTEVRTTETSETKESKFRFLNSQPWYDRIPAMMFFFSQGREAVGSFMQSLIAPKNYAIQYTAVSNQAATTPVSGLIRRRIDFQQFLIPEKVFINGQRFNNWQQCAADYLELSDTIPNPSVEDFSRILLSDNDCNRTFNCATIDGKAVQASNYYVALQRRLPNQYGGLTDYITRNVETFFGDIPLDEEGVVGTTSDVILGGDVYISKHSYMRRMPLFTSLPLGLPNNTEFNTSDYFNIAASRFWLDYSKESALEDILEDIPLIGTFFTDYNLDSVVQIGQCFGPAFSLDFAGVLGGPTYLAAWIASLTEGWNNPFKLAGLYYSHITGIVNYWGESRFVANFRENNELVTSNTINTLSAVDLADPLEYPNPELFQYNLQYLHEGISRQLLSASTQECCDNLIPFRLAFSLAQQSGDLTDKWRVFLPNNYTPLPTDTGKLVTVQEMDEYNLFIGMENGSYITQQDDGLLVNNDNQIYLGSGDAFSRRLRRLGFDQSGYGGIQDKYAIAATRYGLIWYDRRRNRFLKYNGQLSDLTEEIRVWLNRWGNEEVRLGYDPKSENVYVSFSDDKGLLYKPTINKFVSFLDWGVDDFRTIQNNMLSFKNGKAWLHNQTNYQELFGDIRRFEVGMLFSPPLSQTTLQSISVYCESLKLVNEYDHFYLPNNFFDEVLIYNQLYSTGKQKLYLIGDNEKVSLDTIKNELIRGFSRVDDFMYRINGLAILSDQQPIIRNVDGVDYELGENNRKEGRPIQGRQFEARFTHLKKGIKVTTVAALGLNRKDNNP